MANDEKQQQINFGIDPNIVKTLYVDSYLISNNQHVVTFSFAQLYLIRPSTTLLQEFR